MLGLPGAYQASASPDVGKPPYYNFPPTPVTPSLLPVAFPWQNSHLPLRDHFLLGALSILLPIFLPILLQVIEVRFSLSNGHRDPYAGIGDEVAVVIPGASGLWEPFRAPRGCVSGNVVLSFGAREWEFHHQLGLCLGPGQQAGPAEEAAKGLPGAMAKRLDPCQGHLQVVHFPVVVWSCEVVGAEGVQQQGNEQIEHLERRSGSKDGSTNEMSPSVALLFRSQMADGHTFCASPYIMLSLLGEWTF